MNAARIIIDHPEDGASGAPVSETAPTLHVLKQQLDLAWNAFGVASRFGDEVALGREPTTAETTILNMVNDQFDAARAAVLNYTPRSIMELKDKAALVRPTDLNCFADCEEQVLASLLSDIEALPVENNTTNAFDVAVDAYRMADASPDLSDEANAVVADRLRDMLHTRAADLPTILKKIDLAVAGGAESDDILESVTVDIVELAGGAISEEPSDEPVSIAKVWAGAEAELERLGSRPSADVASAAGARIDVAERFVLAGPITCVADAIAKLKVAGQSLEVDGRDVGLDQTAYHDAVAWLEAHG